MSRAIVLGLPDDYDVAALCCFLADDAARQGFRVRGVARPDADEFFFEPRSAASQVRAAEDCQ